MVLSHVDSECCSLLKTAQTNCSGNALLSFYADQGTFQKGGKCMQLPKTSGWDQRFSDHDNYLPLIFF